MKKAKKKSTPSKTKPAKAKKAAPKKAAKKPAPKKAKPAAKPKPAAAPKASGRAKLEGFAWTAGGKTLRLGILFPFSGGDGARKWPDAYTLVDEFNRKHGTAVTIARHEIVDRFLQDDVVGGMLAITLAPYLTRGLLVHEAPGQPLGSEVVTTSAGPRVAAKTGRYAGQSVALWLPDPRAEDIKKTDAGYEVLVDEARWIPIEEPPVRAAWYRLHPKTLVPHGPPHDAEPPNVVVVEGSDEAQEVVVSGGGFVLVPQPERQTRYVIHNSATRADVGPIVRDSTKTRASIGFGLGSVTALVEIGDADARRIELVPARG